MSDLDAFLEDGACSVRVVRRECTTALSPSNLPGLDLALNPYTRCGHGCTYCYAPYVMRVPPSDWTKGIVAKVNIPQVLARELPRKRGVIGLGTVTDPYQPAEREMRLTRRCLEVMTRTPSKVSVLTKSDLVVRDIDLLSELAHAEVGLTLNTSSDQAASLFEPCAPPPSARLAAVRALSSAGIDTYVFLGPLIPTVTDEDAALLVSGIKEAGADRIMVDRLNLRPGMRQRMENVLDSKSPGRSIEFRAEVAADHYYHGKMAEIKDACLKTGIPCQDAF